MVSCVTKRELKYKVPNISHLFLVAVQKTELLEDMRMEEGSLLLEESGNWRPLEGTLLLLLLLHCNYWWLEDSHLQDLQLLLHNWDMEDILAADSQVVLQDNLQAGEDNLLVDLHAQDKEGFQQVA